MAPPITPSGWSGTSVSYTHLQFTERANELDPVVASRARHVISENERTLAAADALANEDMVMMAELMALSLSLIHIFGVLYWEPQSYKNWQGYSLGLMDNGGKPTYALDAFLLQ